MFFLVVATLRWVFCKLHLRTSFTLQKWGLVKKHHGFLLKEVLQNVAFWQFPTLPPKKNNPPAFRFKDTNGGDLGGDSNTMFKGANFQRCLARNCGGILDPMDGTVGGLKTICFP